MARLDTGWHINAKVLQAGATGMALHAWSISYCDAARSDGFVPARAWPSFLGAGVRTLVRLTLWEPVEGGFQLHDYTDYNRTRAQIEADHEGTRERVSRHRSRVSNAVTGPVSNGVTLARAGAPGPGPGAPTAHPYPPFPPGQSAVAPGPAAPAPAPSAEPPPLRHEQQQCPLCPEVFPSNAALREHMDTSPRHKVRPVAADLRKRRSSSTSARPDPPVPADVTAELAAMAARAPFTAADLPPDLLAEHEQRLARERARRADA